MILLESADGTIHLKHEDKNFPSCDTPGEYVEVDKEKEEVNCRFCLNRNGYPTKTKQTISSRPFFALPISM